MNANLVPFEPTAATVNLRCVSWRRLCPVFALLLAVCPFGTGIAAVAAEGACMVTAAKGAELFQQRQIRTRLASGRIVFASRHPEYDGWLVVVFNDQRYDARAEDFKARNDLRDTLLRRGSDAVSEAQDLSRRIGFNESHTLALYAAAAAVRFDSTVQYRYTVQVQQAIVQNGPGMGQVVTQPVYRYVDKISTSRSKSLAKDWREEAGGGEAATDQLYRKRREALVRKAQADAILAHITERFNRFETTLKDDDLEPYVTTSPGTVLFQDKRAVKELDADVVVIGEPSPEHTEWLNVLHLGGKYEARREFLRSRSETAAEYGGRLAALEQKLRDINGQISILTEREQMLAGMRMDALVQAELSHIPLTVYPFPRNFPGNGLYPIPDCPNDAVEVVLRSRVRPIVRDWEREIGQVRASLDALHLAVKDTQSTLATLTPRYEDVMKRFDRVEKAVGTATNTPPTK